MLFWSLYFLPADFETFTDRIFLTQIFGEEYA